VFGEHQQIRVADNPAQHPDGVRSVADLHHMAHVDVEEV
jgi:hypothetical protein